MNRPVNFERWETGTPLRALFTGAGGVMLWVLQKDVASDVAHYAGEPVIPNNSHGRYIPHLLQEQAAAAHAALTV